MAFFSRLSASSTERSTISFFKEASCFLDLLLGNDLGLFLDPCSFFLGSVDDSLALCVPF